MAGLVHLYCGEGKGKSTAAAGLALRAAGAGKRVIYAQFFKDGSSSEIGPLGRLPEVTVCVCPTRFGLYRRRTEEKKAEVLMETLYSHFLKNLEALPEEFRNLISEGEQKEQVVCDFVGAMSDRYAISLYESIFIPKSWQI